MSTAISMNVRLPIEIKKKGAWYVTCCPVLDVCSQGQTRESAKNNLIETLGMFFISCLERGTLDAALRECGFRPGSGGRRASALRTGYVDVPIPLQAIDQSKNNTECHV